MGHGAWGMLGSGRCLPGRDLYRSFFSADVESVLRCAPPPPARLDRASLGGAYGCGRPPGVASAIEFASRRRSGAAAPGTGQRTCLGGLVPGLPAVALHGRARRPSGAGSVGDSWNGRPTYRAPNLIVTRQATPSAAPGAAGTQSSCTLRPATAAPIIRGSPPRRPRKRIHHARERVRGPARGQRGR